MKAHKAWSYAPYRPPFVEVGDIYICRVVPDADSITFSWLPVGDVTYTVCCARRGETPQPIGKTTDTTFCITGLETSAEYAFFVEAAGKKAAPALPAAARRSARRSTIFIPRTTPTVSPAAFSAAPRFCGCPTADFWRRWIFLRATTRRT